jgi:hypothetical protein
MLGAIWGFTRPFERIRRFWRIDFVLKRQKQACFDKCVKSDSRRLHQLRSPTASFVLAGQRVSFTSEVCLAEAFAGFHANAKADHFFPSLLLFTPPFPPPPLFLHPPDSKETCDSRRVDVVVTQRSAGPFHSFLEALMRPSSTVSA